MSRPAPSSTSRPQAGGRSFRVSVIGTGYLGAVHAACLAAAGHRVVGIDTDASRVSALAGGRAPFHEPGLDDLLRTGIDSGRLSFSTDVDRAADRDVHFLCVGTPQEPAGDGADLSYVWSAVRSLARRLSRPCLVVGKSTVPVGTAARLADELGATAPAANGVRLAWNPEFLREGHAVEDTLYPDRLVFGVTDEASNLELRELYASVVPRSTPVVRTDLATAELAKVAANVMLAARLSVMNVLAEVCEVAQADVGDLITVLAHDDRIGRDFLTPGLGFGGGCLPKDLRAFSARAAELGVVEPTRLLAEVDAVNLHQRSRLVDLAARLLARREGRGTVAVLGTAFKPGSDDVRDSPAVDVASRLQALGARVRYYDPKAGESTARVSPELERADDAESACRGADLTLVLTEWEEFRALDPVALAEVVACREVVDARLALDPDKWRAAGWAFHGLGRGSAGA
ncbi:MAG: UDP-glucose dehydrogenase family protein [Nocardioidaceae bacterium]